MWILYMSLAFIVAWFVSFAIILAAANRSIEQTQIGPEDE